MNPLLALAEKWRSEAEILRARGARPQGAVLEGTAAELEDAWLSMQRETLPLRDASKESGYSVGHLARQIRLGKIPNAGRRNAPRIQRKDLPRKLGRRDVPEHLHPLDYKEQIARSVADSTEGARDG